MNAMTTSSITGISANPSASGGSMELICRCDSMAALRAAVDHGADCVHLDYRHDGADIGGQSFKSRDIAKAVRYAHDRRRSVLLELPAKATAAEWSAECALIDRAADAGVDAILLYDHALMLYGAGRHPGLQLHYALPESAVSAESLHFLHRRLGISRVVLPRVLSLPLLERLAQESRVELTVCGQGRFLTSSDNRIGNPPAIRNACAAHLRTSDNAAPVRIAMEACAGSEQAANDRCFTTGRPSDSNTLKLLPRLVALGVRAVWTEAPEHAPTRLAQVARVWREAIDNCLENLDHYAVKPSWMIDLGKARRTLPRR